MYKVIVSSFAEKHALDPFHLSINRKIIIFNIKIHKACFFGSPKAQSTKVSCASCLFNTKKFTNKKLKYNCAPLSRGPYVTNFNWTNIIILYFFKNLLKSQRKIEKIEFKSLILLRIRILMNFLLYSCHIWSSKFNVQKYR